MSLNVTNYISLGLLLNVIGNEKSHLNADEKEMPQESSLGSYVIMSHLDLS